MAAYIQVGCAPVQGLSPFTRRRIVQAIRDATGSALPSFRFADSDLGWQKALAYQSQIMLQLVEDDAPLELIVLTCGRVVPDV